VAEAEFGRPNWMLAQPCSSRFSCRELGAMSGALCAEHRQPGVSGEPTAFELQVRLRVGSPVLSMRLTMPGGAPIFSDRAAAPMAHDLDWDRPITARHPARLRVMLDEQAALVTGAVIAIADCRGDRWVVPEVPVSLEGAAIIVSSTIQQPRPDGSAWRRLPFAPTRPPGSGEAEDSCRDQVHSRHPGRSWQASDAV
jgi:hypothetical protein